MRCILVLYGGKAVPVLEYFTHCQDGLSRAENGRKAYALHHLHCRGGGILHGMVGRELRPHDEGQDDTKSNFLDYRQIAPFVVQ